MPATKILLIRHGHTASNGGSSARMSGRTDVLLSPRGQAEVQRLQDRLRGTVPFAAIYSSPLARARETARALEEAGLGPVRICEGIQEIDCGSLEGMPLDQVRHRYPELWQANLRQIDPYFRWPGGESYREFRCRCLRAVRMLARRHRGEHIALVTHAGVVSQIIGFLAGLSPAQWEPFRPGNTSLTELEWTHRRVILAGFDDREHMTSQPA